MTFNAYIERQKNIIRSRREVGFISVREDERYPVTKSEKLLEELSSLKGLNKEERLYYSR